MESAIKENIPAALIGGATALVLAVAVRKVMKPEKRRWRMGESQIENMQTDYIPPTPYPFSKGTMIKWFNGNSIAWSAGSIGLDPKTNEVIFGGIKA